MTVTHNKKTLITNLTKKGFTLKESTKSVDAIIALIKSHLLNKRTVPLPKYGNLVPRFKAGGREVRNPRTLEKLAMKDTATITRTTHKYNPENKKVGTLELIKELTCELGDGALSEATFKAFVGAVTSTITGESRLEIRGFGVFYAKLQAKKLARNPKSGETAWIEERYIPRFLVSKSVKIELTHAYLADLNNHPQ